MRYLFPLLVVCCLLSCADDAADQPLSLDTYLAQNDDLVMADLVACAGGSVDGLLESAELPTDVFFYPVIGATDFKYFEAAEVADSLNFDRYFLKALDDEPVFNGYLWKFNNEPFAGERMGVVTYKTPGNIHVCTPIRLKTNLKPTEVNNDLVSVTEDGVTPDFSWSDGQIQENVIYFQVVSDLAGNLISGTYTVETNFTFYDLENVVFNITDPNANPSLEPNSEYRFTLMGVSEDNWVNLLAEQVFSTGE